MKLAFSMPHQLRIPAMTQPWELDVTGPDQIALLKFAEKLGFEMAAVPEHYAMPSAHQGLSGDFYMNGCAGMGVYAGATETMRINSCISLLPLQHPITTAKQLATLDWLTGGRITITWAVGWCEGEFELMGVDFRKRGAIAEEYTRAIIELWTSPNPEFEGEFVSFRDMVFEPRCVQAPHIPIWFGGDADAVLRRVGRHANGWWPTQTAPDKLPERLDFIRSQPDYAGKLEDVFLGLAAARMTVDHKPLGDPAEKSGRPAQEIIDRLGWYADLGVTWSGIPIPPCSGLAEYRDYVQWVAEEIIPAVR